MMNFLMRGLRFIFRRFQINSSSIIYRYKYLSFNLSPPLPLPEGVSEKDLFEFVTSIRVKDSSEDEMKAYGTNDFKRFVYTWGLAKEINGKCLELGGNPYFTTMLLKKFTNLDVSLATISDLKIMGNFLNQLNTRTWIIPKKMRILNSNISMWKKIYSPIKMMNLTW